MKQDKTIWVALRDGVPTQWLWATSKTNALRCSTDAGVWSALRTELRRIPREFQGLEGSGATYEPLTRCVVIGTLALDVDDCGECVGGAKEPTPRVKDRAKPKKAKPLALK